ncbi:MAG: hypothetical protein R2838_09895 [Caldilineaceae bacterium]
MGTANLAAIAAAMVLTQVGGRRWGHVVGFGGAAGRSGGADRGVTVRPVQRLPGRAGITPILATLGTGSLYTGLCM